MKKKLLGSTIKSWIIFLSVFMIYGFLAGILTDYAPYQVGLSAIPLAVIYIFIENKFFNKSAKD
tara:strand:- start:294 stop:485 length:192 start_codon:yes stop_codon:yes gene_type:complete